LFERRLGLGADGVLCGVAQQEAPCVPSEEIELPRVPVDFAVPRGDTAGANMLLESVTVQAGDRDLLEVGVIAYWNLLCPSSTMRKVLVGG
jgi:hypothetical protein